MSRPRGVAPLGDVPSVEEVVVCTQGVGRRVAVVLLLLLVEGPPGGDVVNLRGGAVWVIYQTKCRIEHIYNYTC